MDKQELLRLIDEMIAEGNISNIKDLVETGLNEIQANTYRVGAQEGYRDGFADGKRQAASE